MSAGPILIFDKSALESLSVDEAVWLGQFYTINVVPVFFAETLADLSKTPADQRTPEQVVRRLAEKTACMSAKANTHHNVLCRADLAGQRVEMRSVPVLSHGRSVEREGRKGVVFDLSHESKALERWQRGEFAELDREHARAWRAALADIDLSLIAKAAEPLFKSRPRAKSLDEVKQTADAVLNSPARAESVLGTALKQLGVPHEEWGAIFERWTNLGRPPLSQFAPYAAHVMCVDLFFTLAIAHGLLGSVRASNKIDISYLYYLPFCMVFTSKDNLHAKCAPLFLKGKQRFVWAEDLKADLRRIDEHFAAFPDEVKARGVMSFANRPPDDQACLTTRLWDEFMAPTWRETRNKAENVSAEEKERDREMLRQMAARLDTATAADGEVRIDNADWVIITSKVPRRLGKWKLVPDDV